MNDVTRIGSSGTVTTGGAAAPPSESPETSRFRELFEKLQRLSREQREQAPVESADDLQQAMRNAEDRFQTAMDVRRQLEEAFRRHSS